MIEIGSMYTERNAEKLAKAKEFIKGREFFKREWVPAIKTDVKATFDRIRAEQDALRKNKIRRLK